jgi:Uma2 family endonuclease
MALVAMVSAEEYLSTVYETECEYADGELVERNMGESDHSGIQMALAALLYNQRRALGIHVFPELRVQVAPNRFRVPDIAVTTRKIQGRILHEPPLLWIEILSPEDCTSRMEAKVAEILHFGVPHIWVLDPKQSKAWSYTKESRQDAREVLEIPHPKIVIKLAEIFGALGDEIEL